MQLGLERLFRKVENWVALGFAWGLKVDFRVNDEGVTFSSNKTEEGLREF